MKKIYDLASDAVTVAALQNGSLSSGATGLRITHGLVGSEEWWRHVRDGSLPLQIREGVVSGFWPGQFGGGPAEFRLRSSDGAESMWLCEVEPSEARQEFQIGREVRVEFVFQKLKTAFNGSNESKVVVSLSVGEAQQCHACDARNARA
jgi:hypothetical protein